jgi:hypothetical protein
LRNAENGARVGILCRHLARPIFLGHGRFELRLLLGKLATIALGIDRALHAVFIGARQFLRKARDMRMGGKPDIGLHWFQHAEAGSHRQFPDTRDEQPADTRD